MAELVGIIKIATVGFKLSITLFSFASAIGSAGKDIIQTGKDISLFSSVLRQLAYTMQRAHKAGQISDAAFQDTELIVAECKKIFASLDELIAKATSMEIVKVIKMEEDANEVQELDLDKLTVSYGKRLMFLFRKSEILQQRKALESLKSSLQLLLCSMMFTERKMQFAEERTEPAIVDLFLAEEKLGLESLVLANQAAATEYRKNRPQAAVKKGTFTSEENITDIGMVGRLFTSQTAVPVLNSGSAKEETRPRGSCNSSGRAELDSSPVASVLYAESSNSSSMFSSFTKSKPVQSEMAFVFVPPPLEYNSQGNVAYSSIASSSIISSTHSPPSTTEESAGASKIEQPVKPVKSMASSRVSKSTPSIAVDMLLKRVAAHKDPQKSTSEPKSEPAPSTPKQPFCHTSGNQLPSYEAHGAALPPGWEQRLSNAGKLYYMNHNTKSTTWTRSAPASFDGSKQPVSAASCGDATYSETITESNCLPIIKEVNDNGDKDKELYSDLFQREARPY